MGDKTPAADVMTYADIMKAQQLQRDTDNTMKNIADKQKAAAELMEDASGRPTKASGLAPPVIPVASTPDKARKRNRWDQGDDDGAGYVPSSVAPTFAPCWYFPSTAQNRAAL